MIHVLGDDPDGDEHLASLQVALGEPDFRALNTAVFDGQKLVYDELVGACEAMPFLATSRLVIIRGLLSRLEPKSGRDGDGKGEAQEARKPTELVRLLSEYLVRLPCTVELALVDAKPVTRQNPLYQALVNGKARFAQMGQLEAAELAGWIERRVKGKGGRLANGVNHLLATYHDGNLRGLDSELDKLVAYAGSDEIDRVAVERLLIAVREQSVYKMCDAIADGNAAVALQHLHALLDDGSAPLYLLSMVVRHFRLLIQVKELRASGMSLQLVAGRLRLQGFVAERLDRQLRRFTTFERLEGVLRQLLDADLAAKSGGRNLSVNLEVLMAELAVPRRAAGRY